MKTLTIGSDVMTIDDANNIQSGDLLTLKGSLYWYGQGAWDIHSTRLITFIQHVPLFSVRYDATDGRDTAVGDHRYSVGIEVLIAGNVKHLLLSAHSLEKVPVL
jgi:hypothetical protein